MNNKNQVRKAELLLALHHDPKLVILPNIWDPLGARLLESLGFPAVATASAAVAFSLGYDDGQRITFDAMLDVVNRVAASVEVPLTADIERGYAEDTEELADNVRRVIRVGAVGINLEDSTGERGTLFPIEVQCDRLRAARAAADLEGLPLVINARTDVFLENAHESHDDKVRETIARAKAYMDAGADCVYPITVGDTETLKQILAEVRTPINVYASQGTAPMRELENLGVSRLSLGPWVLRASLARIKEIALALKNYDSFDVFTDDAVVGKEIKRYISDDRME
jgi:2-methylisocitrate lyase-like PEP mutase family enzyme